MSKVKDAFAEEFQRQLEEEWNFQVSEEELIYGAAAATNKFLTEQFCPCCKHEMIKEEVRYDQYVDGPTWRDEYHCTNCAVRRPMMAY